MCKQKHLSPHALRSVSALLRTCAPVEREWWQQARKTTFHQAQRTFEQWSRAYNPTATAGASKQKSIPDGRRCGARNGIHNTRTGNIFASVFRTKGSPVVTQGPCNRIQIPADLCTLYQFTVIHLKVTRLCCCCWWCYAVDKVTLLSNTHARTHIHVAHAVCISYLTCS